MEHEFRVGQGYDIHQLVEGRDLILGGVKIPYAKGLLGHSDADALLHALMDAVLGAAGKDDIRKRFPASSPEWKDAKSSLMLEIVSREVKAEGWRIQNADCYLLAEAPKLSPYFPAMKENISRILGLASGYVSVKASTTEGLGFIGRGEGIFASATVLLCRPVSANL